MNSEVQKGDLPELVSGKGGTDSHTLVSLPSCLASYEHPYKSLQGLTSHCKDWPQGQVCFSWSFWPILPLAPQTCPKKLYKTECMKLGQTCGQSQTFGAETSCGRIYRFAPNSLNPSCRAIQLSGDPKLWVTKDSDQFLSLP